MTLRLVDGCHLYPGPDGVWRYYLPGGEFVRISAPAAMLSQAQRLLHGASPEPEAGADVEGLGAFLDALCERGVLAEPPPSGPERSVRTVHVDGDNPIGHAVADLLGAQVKVTVGTADEAAVAAADAVVSCAGWLPDAAWQRLDGWCARHGRPWHMVYAEGTTWYLGPMSVPGRTAGYRDVRARRLAACGVADELTAYWAYLDVTTAAPPVPWPSPAEAAVVAGLLATDVLAYRDRGTPAADGVQLAVHLAGGRVERHAVLPLPAVAR
jgi:hypothetical protein